MLRLQLFNREAMKWNRRGHSGNPEPPTLIWRASNGQGAIWLGGLPQVADINFMKDNNITLLVSAMKQTAADSGGYRGSQALQLAVPVSYQGRDRQDQLRQVMVASLGVGQSIWFHCMAGVHRGPILCAAAVAFVQRLEFWQVYANIEPLRNIDRRGVLERPGGSGTFSWAEGQAAAPTDPVKMFLPVQWDLHAGARHGMLLPITVWEIGSNHTANGGKVLLNLCSRARSSPLNRSERQCWLSVISARPAWRQHQQETKP